VSNPVLGGCVLSLSGVCSALVSAKFMLRAHGATVCDVALCAKLCVGCVGGPSPNLCSIPLCLPAQNLFESRQEGERGRERDM